MTSKYGGNDCSWFVKNIYMQAGYSLGVNKGSSEMFNQMVNDPNHWLTSVTIGIDNWNLEKGDIVFWEGPNRCDCITKYHHSACARLWKIHHIGIYIGDNMILDNAPGTNVSIRSIYDVGTKIAGYARRAWD